MQIAKVLLILFVLFNTVSFSQLLNSSFESWDDNGNPTYWITGWYEGIEQAVTASADAQDGVYSAKIEIKDFLGQLYSGNLQSIDSVNALGHPISERYGNLSGYYKFLPKGSGHLIIVVSVYNSDFNLLGVGGVTITDESNTWSQFNAGIDYFMDGNAATVVVSISIADTSSEGYEQNTIGSEVYVDNLSLGNPTNVFNNPEIPLQFSLNQNYPNPFNPLTTISFELQKESDVILQIYNPLGIKIEEFFEKKLQAGFHEIEFIGNNKSSGVYYYRMQAGEYIKTKKMLLLK